MVNGSTMPAARAYEIAARDMHDTLRRIESMTFWDRPSPDSPNGRILASLEAKRDRDQGRLIELKRAADAENPRYTARQSGASIKFKSLEWHPIGTAANDESITPDLPACLRRVPA